MAKFSFGQIRIGTSEQETPTKADSDTPFRIAILGDFSGRGNRGISDILRLATLRPVAVDRDNFDQVMARMNPELHLPLGGAKVKIGFKELDDFRPDRLFREVSVFQSLRDTRDRLNNSGSFPAAAEEVRGWSQKPIEEPAAKTEISAPTEKSKLSPARLLDDILMQTSEKESTPAADLRLFLQKAVAPYVVSGKQLQQQAELVAQVDDAVSGVMSSILHQRDYQDLEATWRGLYLLIRRLETDGPLKLLLIDVSKDELATDLLSSEDLQNTNVYRLLVEQTVGTPGAQLWSLLVGSFSFAPTTADIELLARLTKIAAAAGAPIVSAATPAFVGTNSFAESPDPEAWTKPINPDAREAWDAMRQLPEAASLGLAVPRILLRLPYGPDTDPVDAFDFDEMGGKPAHESYLWGNPAFGWALLFGSAFNRRGWEFRARIETEIDGLPVHTFDDDGESAIKPCAEAVLGTRAQERIMSEGIMPVLSVQNSDRVQFSSVRSVAQGAKSLAGRWM